MYSLISVDTFFIFVIITSILIGFLRGFVKEVISILALLLAAWVAVNYGSYLGSYFAPWINDPNGQLWAGFLFGFLSIIIAGMIIARLLSKIFRLSLSAKIDRIFGAVFGCFRGAILLAIIVMGGQLTSFQEKAWWIESSYVPYAKLLADKMIEHAPRSLEFLNNSQRND